MALFCGNPCSSSTGGPVPPITLGNIDAADVGGAAGEFFEHGSIIVYSAATGAAPVAAGRFTRKHSGISARHSHAER